MNANSFLLSTPQRSPINALRASFTNIATAAQSAPWPNRIERSVFFNLRGIFQTRSSSGNQRLAPPISANSASLKQGRMGLLVPATMDDELELELELLVHEVTANLDPVNTKYRNAYIFICLALLSTQNTKRRIPTLKRCFSKNLCFLSVEQDRES